MSMTPGPWELIVQPGGEWGKIYGPILDGDRECVFVDVDLSTPEGVANANAAVALPDLLAAVQAMLEEYEEGKEHPMYEVREMCRAAIAKATGKE